MSASGVPVRVLRVALAAEESAGTTVLKRLRARGHDLAAVVSAGRGSGLGSSVAEHASQQGLPVRPPSDMRDPAFASWLKEQQVDLLLNVHSLVIAAGEVVEAPRLGSFNLHPGPLPHYAGLDVPSWAVLRGETRHGVTLHRMTAAVDAGPVAFRADFDVRERDTALTVFSTCIREGCRLVEQLLDVLERGETVPEHPQDPAQRQWFPGGPPDGGVLRWERSAREVVAFVRACDYGPFPSPWGHPRCFLGGRQVEVLRASLTGLSSDVAAGTVGETSEAGALVAAADDWVLVEQVEVDGRRVHPAEVLTTGQRLLGDVLHA